MYRKFIATITAASIALTTLGAVPAFAGERENARLLAAILGIAAVGTIIHKNNKRDKDKHHQSKPEYYQPQLPKPVYTPPRYQQPKPRPLPKRAHSKLLPKQCLRSFETHRGKVRMFGAHCLNKRFDFAHRLPRECEYTFNTNRGDRRGYLARCLRERGYRLARG